MNGVHDMGGMHGFGPIVREENEPLFHAAWEAHVRAIDGAGAWSRGYFNIDAFRYGIERMAPAHYLRASYYERWLATIELNLIEQGFLTGDELDARIESLAPGIPRPRFRRHDAVSADRAERSRPRSPTLHFRAALRGGRRRGDAQRPPARAHPAAALRARQAGRHPTPARSRRSFPTPTPTGLARQPQPLYAVRFDARELWGESAEPGQTVSPRPVGKLPGARSRVEHGSGQTDWTRPVTARMRTMTYDPEQEPYVALRTKALESLLIEKGLLSAEAVDERISEYERDIGPLKGARVVARAWVDPDFKERLLQDGAAIAELGLPGGGNLVVVENTPTEHHMVVCTLCSCYPWMVLGLPPTWYKSFAYRSRAVIEPRAVLREFGLELDEGVTVHVHDSSAEVRYMVLPERPAGTEGLTRGGAGGAGHARRHDRRGQGRRAGACPAWSPARHATGRR